MRSKLLNFLGVAVLCVICGLVAWRLRQAPERGNDASAGDATVSSMRVPEDVLERKKPRFFETSFTVDRMSGEHERTPTVDEWKELIRILLHAPDGALVESAKARIAVHAGPAELAVLENAYAAPANDDVRQRVLEVFSSLQSADFMDTARRILNDETLPISDHLVNACAAALARRGEHKDVEAIFRRLNSAGEDTETGGSLYSDTDGLVGAISVLENPALEKLLCHAAAGHGLATTNRARAAAATALGNFHTVEVTMVLYDLAKNANDLLVRRRAEESLKEIQTPE